MKRILFICLVWLTVIFTVPAYAAGTDRATVTFQFFIDLSLDGQCMELMFENQESGKEVEVVCKDYKSQALTTTMPVGTYHLKTIRFNDNLYFDYKYYTTPDTFTVKKGEQTAPIYVFAVSQPVTPMPVNTRFICSEQNQFDGTLQISLHAVLDVFYADAVTYRQEDVTVVLNGVSEKEIELDAGNYEVIDVNAYDASHHPVAVAFPKSFTIDRNADTTPEIRLMVGNEELEQTDMVSKKVDEMPTYRYLRDQKTELSLGAATGQKDVIDEILQASGDTKQKNEIQSVVKNPDMKNQEGDAVEDQREQTGNPQRVVVPMAVLLACVGMILFVRKRSFR